ncbi:MAG: Rpn family recombination-promoting nuclease/putative transposase [Treponema sp.]|nr:Rpn family recombination-promoting nuclease/putative transposase [Treponema sp.]
MAKNKRKHRSKGRGPAYSKEILGLAALMVAQKKLIPLKDDVSFKMFLSSPTVESNACLRSMLSAMTGREITRARVTNSELVPEFARGKMPRMDVNCTFNDGQKADIELQLTTAGDDQKLRALYYASKLYAGSLRKGKLYKNAPNVYQIFLTDFDPFDDSKTDVEKENIRTGKFYHRAMMRLDDGSVFADRLQILFFNLNVPDGGGRGLEKGRQLV